tara:strand:- start:4732 stop:7164 length:2433 start_codon:yes stop_codon:yes gene_type:complete
MPRAPKFFPTNSCLALIGASVLASAGFSLAQPNFEKDIQPFIETHCVRCHGDKKQKGDFRVDTLSREVGLKDTPYWHEVMEKISSGEMPPDDEDVLPSVEESAAIVEWLAARIKEGESARMAQRDRVSYHRLTREEYVNTVRDLIGVEYDATDPGGLLEDPEWHGFERIGSVLTLSPTHIEKYMKAAEIVLDEAYPDKPVEYLEATTPAVIMRDNHPHYERLKNEGLLDKTRFEIVTSGEVFRNSNPYRDGLKFPGPGMYEISYTLSGLKPENKAAPRMQVYEHKLDRVLFEQDIIAPEDEPVTVSFRAHFPDVRSPSIHVLNLTGPPRHPRSTAHSQIPFISTKERRAPWQIKITDQDGKPRYPFLILDSITMRGPIVTEEEQKRRDDYMPKEESLDAAREGLGRMAKRAFRRPLYEGELDIYLDIVSGELEAGADFKTAVEAGMVAILCSKSFLFLAEGDENSDRHNLNDWELASRLSYLLWSTMPDDELFAAAEAGKLRDQAELQRQFERLLADPRSERFKKSFSKQWLNLQKVGMFPPDKKIYPQYDAHLEQSMIGETQAFFAEVLEQGLSLREFLDSDWTMVNPRLAKFYGIPSITQDEFQRVSLKPEFNRGGLLTQASILSLTSDGTRHRPVHRGAWVSEVILGKTPPPPPANVDPIEPNPVDSPKATLRMKLEAHKADPSCASCHAKIDPLGLAFDNFNAIGEWRTHENVEGTGDDPAVDPSGELPDGRAFQNAEEFKQLLMADLDAFQATFIEKLATYGMRRTLSVDDHDDLETIAEIGREKDYRVRDILEAFILSELFQKR